MRKGARCRSGPESPTADIDATLAQSYSNDGIMNRDEPRAGSTTQPRPDCASTIDNDQQRQEVQGAPRATRSVRNLPSSTVPSTARGGRPRTRTRAQTVLTTSSAPVRGRFPSTAKLGKTSRRRTAKQRRSTSTSNSSTNPPPAIPWLPSHSTSRNSSVSDDDADEPSSRRRVGKKKRPRDEAQHVGDVEWDDWRALGFGIASPGGQNDAYEQIDGMGGRGALARWKWWQNDEIGEERPANAGPTGDSHDSTPRTYRAACESESSKEKECRFAGAGAAHQPDQNRSTSPEEGPIKRKRRRNANTFEFAIRSSTRLALKHSLEHEAEGSTPYLAGKKEKDEKRPMNRRVTGRQDADHCLPSAEAQLPSETSVVVNQESKTKETSRSQDRPNSGWMME
ncbi:hypothetical protein JCM11491_001089 [Sporobolomyces phaffii]